MSEAFISYAREDRSLVVPIAARLQQLGVEVWFDADLKAGDAFSDVILNKLQKAKAVVVCWSPTSALSPWVRGEAQYARKLNSYVPVFIEECELLPPYNELHTDDLSKWAGKGKTRTGSGSWTRSLS
jgi:adenylate cyclase